VVQGRDEKFSARFEVFREFSDAVHGLVDEHGLAEYYDGSLRIIDSEGTSLPAS